MTEADILATLYEDIATIKRPTPIKNGRFDDYEDVPVYTDLPCGISYTQGSKTGKTDTTQEIDYVAVLFARPEVVIEPGDVVIATKGGQTLEFTAGEGPVYPGSHIEIPLIRDDKA